MAIRSSARAAVLQRSWCVSLKLGLALSALACSSTTRSPGQAGGGTSGSSQTTTAGTPGTVGTAGAAPMNSGVDSGGSTSSPAGGDNPGPIAAINTAFGVPPENANPTF